MSPIPPDPGAIPAWEFVRLEINRRDERIAELEAEARRLPSDIRKATLEDAADVAKEAGALCRHENAQATASVIEDRILRLDAEAAAQERPAG